MSYVFSDPTFSQCHASTIAETEHGLFMACFAGPREGHERTGIWAGTYINDAWCNQKQIIDSRQDDGQLVPLWNPVLFSTNDELRLYYRIGQSPENWSCAYISSLDQAQSWSRPSHIPSVATGPVRNKPLLLEDSSVITPTSTELNEWAIHFEIVKQGDTGIQKVCVQHGNLKAIQPVILPHGNGVLQALCRTRNSYIAETWSYDNGQSWSQLVLTGIRNSSAALDAIRIDDLGFVLVYNDCSVGRYNLTLAVSKDGRHWTNKKVLENSMGEYAYPCMTSTRNGALHILYSYNRKNIKHIPLAKSELDRLFN